MGWRSAKGQVAAGTYDNPGIDEGGSFAQGFASSFVPLISSAADDYANEKRETRLLELKESLYRQRPRAASTTVSDRKAKSDLQEIQALSTQLGIPAEEASNLFYAHDGDSSQAANTYNELQRTGGTVGTVVPDLPPVAAPGGNVEDEMSAIIPTGEEDVATASVDEETPTDNLEQAGQGLAFEPFQVSSLGSIEDDLSLLTGEEGSEANITAATKTIEGAIEVADASGQTPVVTYGDVLQAGATGSEVAQIVAKGTRLSAVFQSTPVSEIKTLEEARTTLTILDARRAEIGGTDEFDQNSRPILEKLISDLTELPDLGAMLQDNSRDKLQEFVANGYTLYAGKVDEQRLNAHVARATELLNSASSMPEIPKSLAELQQMQARVSANEFQSVPTEWVEALNTSTRKAQLQDRYGDKLTVDYIMSDDRTPRELQLLKDTVTASFGEEHPALTDLNIALGTPFEEALVAPKLSDVTLTNYMSLSAEALAQGDTSLSDSITRLGNSLVEAADAGVDIETVTESNWLSKAAAARADGDVVTAEIIEKLGATYDGRKKDADTSGKLPLLSDVRKENWRSLSAQATAMGDTELANGINSLGGAYDKAAASGDTRTTDLLGEVSQVLARAGTDIRNTNAQAESYIGAIDSAYRLNTLLQENPNINYFFGGTVPSAITKAVGEIGAIASLVKGNDVNPEDALASVASFERNMEEKFLSGNITEDARAYAVYKAQEARLAFQIARLQQGPAGVISNQDFDSALRQVRSSSNSKTFEASLRGLVGAEEVKVLTAVDNLMRNPQIQIAQKLQEELNMDLTAGSLRTMEQRVSDVGADAALAWIKGGPSIAPQPAEEEPATGNSRDNPVSVTTLEQATALTEGTFYMTPDGTVRER